MKKQVAITMASMMAVTQFGSLAIADSHNGENNGAKEVKKEDKNVKTNVERISGSTRYETAIKVSQETYNTAESVVLASGVMYQDALSGTVLAGYLKSPILLTSGKNLEKSVLEEIVRLKAKNVYILGGLNSVSEDVVKNLPNGIRIVRLAGANRYETSEKIANKLKEMAGYNDVAIASGNVYADSLSASPAMAKVHTSIVLTDGVNLPKTIDKSRIKYIIGGEKTIKADVNADRIAGANRYKTSLNIYNKFFAGADKLVVASGTMFPDALSASGYAIKNNMPIILSEKDSLDKDVFDAISKKGNKFVFVGGEQTLSPVLKNSLETKAEESNNYDKLVEEANDIKEALKLKRLDDNDVIAMAKDGETMPQAKARVKKEVAEKVDALLKEIEANKNIDDAKYKELHKTLHGYSVGHNFMLKMEVVGDKKVKSIDGTKIEGKYTRVSKDKDGKYVIDIKTPVKGLEKKTDEAKKYLFLNYVTKADFDKAYEGDNKKDVSIKDGNVDAITSPTPRYNRNEVPATYEENKVVKSFYDITATDDGYKIVLNNIPAGAYILKPVMIEKLSDHNKLEYGAMVFVDQSN